MPAYRRALLTVILLASGTRVLGDGRTLVSVEAQNRNIREVLQALAAAAKVELTIRPEVRGVVSTTIHRTPFEQALTVVAATQGYGWRLVNGVYLVGRFSAAGDDGREVKGLVEAPPALAAALARAFGHLDLASLESPGAGLDLRVLLPPGLTGPPRPVEKGLEVTGSRAAVEDFKFLARSLLAGQITLRWRVLLVRLDGVEVRELPVSWAKGPMSHGLSPGRELLYSSGDFAQLLRRLEQGGAGFTPLIDETFEAPALATVAREGVAGEEGYRLKLAARVDTGLQLQLWLDAAWRGRPAGEAPAPSVGFRLDGAPLPPEEGVVMLSRPRTGEPGPDLLLVLLPTALVPPAE